ncbi:DNA-3-methyladenine glycosylase [Aerococcus kribbianus]|uniref:Putative 3-methyladenine DNA glycosylase n=1 Tax=Aerococcus kribbianus TaxID=2999064 RepID=A0A9X3JCT7_9LACT|nr:MULTISPECIES: DNA-3-methyladenine glycosylase [unclassified Aerococcus]MCZ0716810.1 DNA-3-methyladenine glycosylase [Aerococcus sp. YH-aer221]MCZ0725098.1 DNA-3-methyladenine glycosylase [Aerococcus sp. YH-aer222]
MSFITDPQFSTAEIARQFLGCLLVHEQDGQRLSGWIVETEAYLGEEDQAAHTYNKHYSDRVKALYGPAGTFYIHQMMQHTMINISTQAEGVGEGVLIRAIQPYQGIDEMAANRPNKSGYELTNGPGKLVQALGVGMEAYGTSYRDKPLFIDLKLPKLQVAEIKSSPRIGIPNKGKWTEAELRYYVGGNPYVSRKRGKIRKDWGWLTSPPN